MTVETVGSILLSQSSFVDTSSTIWSGSLEAKFTTGPGGTLPGCTATTMSGCSIVRCAPWDAGVSTADAGITTFASAGLLTISGTMDGGYALMPAAFGSVVSYITSWSNQLWSGGESLSVSGGGSMVPAFTSPALVAPSVMPVTSPDCENADCVLSRSSDLVINWTGPTTRTGSVRVTLGSSQGVSSSTVTCTFMASQNSATIPGAVMANLYQTLLEDGGMPSTGGSGIFTVENITSTGFDAGAYSIKFEAAHVMASGLADYQ